MVLRGDEKKKKIEKYIHAHRNKWKKNVRLYDWLFIIAFITTLLCACLLVIYNSGQCAA